MRKREHHQHQQVFPSVFPPNRLTGKNSNNKPSRYHKYGAFPLFFTLSLLLFHHRFVNEMIINIIVTRSISPPLPHTYISPLFISGEKRSVAIIIFCVPIFLRFNNCKLLCVCVLVNHVIEAISWQFYKVSVRNWGCLSGGKGFGDRLVGLVVVQ